MENLVFKDGEYFIECAKCGELRSTDQAKCPNCETPKQKAVVEKKVMKDAAPRKDKGIS